MPKATARAAQGQNPLPVLLQAAVLIVMVSAAILAIYAVFPSLVLRALVGSAYVRAASLVLPYGFAMAMLAATSLATAYQIGVHRFDFVAPLVIVTFAEMITLALYHPSLDVTVRILVIGHTLGFLTAFQSIWRAASQHSARASA